MTFNEAISYVDFNTLGLLIGMMIIVDVVKRSGLFEYLAIKGAKWSGGDPAKMLVVFTVITAFISAFLDNVTTVLLVTLVILLVTDALNINPIPLLMAEIFASNIGGTSTLIGDPPNVMIGTEAGLSFMDFVINQGPIAFIVLIITILIMKFYYYRGSKSVVSLEKLKKFDESKAIQDASLLKKSLMVLSAVILAFIFHEKLHMEPATIALLGGFILLLVSRVQPEEVLKEVEWTTIFFFIGLFILVGSIEKAGVIEWIAKNVLALTGGNMMLTGLTILFSSAILSAFIDNIPFVATMIPLIQAIGQLSGVDIHPYWWALSLGACLGGNGTLIGATANVVVAGIARKNGYVITFRDYFKLGFPTMLAGIFASAIYLLAVYF
ncbi:MAG: ArsB/NhaD family transporter [Thermosediminibacteraceae bacterium]|nr:ArsB/NhaD family transporter [Thermosediminibacteraceae bacterium]